NDDDFTNRHEADKKTLHVVDDVFRRKFEVTRNGDDVDVHSVAKVSVVLQEIIFSCLTTSGPHFRLRFGGRVGDTSVNRRWPVRLIRMVTYTESFSDDSGFSPDNDTVVNTTDFTSIT